MDTFLGDRATVLFPSIAARIAHLTASDEYRKARQYRQSEWLGFRLGRYDPTINHRAVIDRYRRSAEHYAATAKLLEADARKVAERRAGK